MSPEAELHLSKARRTLSKARAMVAIELADEAGRCAYLAAFHAAQAFTRRFVECAHGLLSEA
jgi:uncharacterized protein (UPF0332 family)